MKSNKPPCLYIPSRQMDLRVELEVPAEKLRSQRNDIRLIRITSIGLTTASLFCLLEQSDIVHVHTIRHSLQEKELLFRSQPASLPHFKCLHISSDGHFFPSMLLLTYY
jgi:hypothetical protein